MSAVPNEVSINNLGEIIIHICEGQINRYMWRKGVYILYSRIAAILKERELTFAELSRLSGVPDNVFSNLKSRGGKISLDNANKIAKALEVPIEKLLEE